MSYTRNFGFRDFTNIVRNGRFRTPASGALQIGSPVILDSTTAGRMKAATAGVAANAAAGIVVFEHIQVKGVDPALYGDGDFATAPVNVYAQIVRGPGVKVWLRKTAAKTLYDGRVIAAYNPFNAAVDLDTLAVGDQLTPDGSGLWKAANGTTDGAWLTVESVNASTGVVDARVNF
jgi:hypothetical protein